MEEDAVGRNSTKVTGERSEMHLLVQDDEGDSGEGEAMAQKTSGTQRDGTTDGRRRKLR